MSRGGVESRAIPTGGIGRNTKMTLTCKTARGRFVRHYVEMVIAMFIGMGVFWPVWLGLFALIGQPQLSDRTDVDAMTMALNMSLGMAGWMRFRGHRWAPILEMC